MGEGGHLFRLTCSVVLWGGRDTANKYHLCVCGVFAVSGPHWVCPSSLWHVFPGSKLLRLQGALQGHCPKWALHFMQFPGISHSGSLQRHRPRWAVCFVPFPGPSSSGNWVLDESTVPGGLCFYSPPWSWSLSFPGVPLEHSPRCFVCLLWGADLRL